MKLKADVKELQIHFTPWKLIEQWDSKKELEMYAWYKSDEGEPVVVAVVKRLLNRDKRVDYVRFSPIHCEGRRMYLHEVGPNINGVRRWVMEELSSEWRDFAPNETCKTKSGYLKMKKHRVNVAWDGMNFQDGKRMYNMRGDVCTF